MVKGDKYHRYAGDDSSNFDCLGNLHCGGTCRWYFAGFKNRFFTGGNAETPANWRADWSGGVGSYDWRRDDAFKSCVAVWQWGVSGTAGNSYENDYRGCHGGKSSVDTDFYWRFYRRGGWIYGRSGSSGGNWTVSAVWIIGFDFGGRNFALCFIWEKERWRRRNFILLRSDCGRGADGNCSCSFGGLWKKW